MLCRAAANLPQRRTVGPVTAEYDAFGPWVYQVRTPEVVPRLFRGGPLDLDRSELVIKVPRNIARRDATPQMDLYDHVLAAGPDELTLLSRQPSGYTTAAVPYAGIAAIESGTDLLDGRLTVHRTGGAPALTVGYNGSSQDVVDRLVRVIRSRYLRDPGPGVQLPDEARDGEVEFEHFDADLALVSEYGAVLRTEPAVTFLAAHERRAVAPRDGRGAWGWISRLVHFAWPMTLQGAILCADPHELTVIHRRVWWVRGHVPVHSVCRTTIPLSRLEWVSVQPHPTYAGVVVATLHVGGTELTLPLPETSDAASVLRRAPLPHA